MATETTKLTFVEGAAAATPAAGRGVVYFKADGLAYSKDDAGVETLMSGGAGGAPSTADYLVGTANGGLSAEIVVGTSPGGELGGTWASPTVDATHSGSAHLQKYSEGTSQPGSPSTNDKFYRTDLNLLTYYDGTRWLTVTKYPHYFSMLDAAVNTGITATQHAARGMVPLKGIRGIWVEEFQAATFVSTTNNGTNFWTVALVRQDLDAASNTVASFTTGSGPDTASKHVNHVTASVGAVLDTSAVVLNVTVTKTLSPGLILVSGAIMWYRGIVT